MMAINKYCPRSGKLVEKDSLTQYKGFTVGFCNPGCRDDFVNHPEKCLKEAFYFDVILRENYDS